MALALVPSQVTTRRGGQRWTTDDPPAKIRDFCHWWVHEREHGQGARDYAAFAGYSEQTICLWLKDPRVLHVLDAEVMGTAAGPLRVLDVLNMLHKRATEDEDVKAAGLYLQAVGRMAPRQVDVRVTDARTLTDEQLRVELQRAVALLGEAPEIEDAVVVSDTESPTEDSTPGG